MIDIVVQGPVYSYTREFINRYREFSFVNRVIFSTWKENEVLYGDWDIDALVTSDYPNNPGLGNRNLQIVSSLAGINKITSSVVLKVRSDMFLPNLSEMWNFYCTQRVNNNILTLSLYSRYPFHPRDHVFIGSSQNVWDLFDIPLDKVQNTVYNQTQNVRSETYLGAHYLKKFEPRIEKFLEYPQVYLTDNSLFKAEALEISNRLIQERIGFQPFPQIPIEWPKHYPNGYPFQRLKEEYGEKYHDDL